jgi:hypothetical protein
LRLCEQRHLHRSVTRLKTSNVKRCSILFYSKPQGNMQSYLGNENVQTRHHCLQGWKRCHVLPFSTSPFELIAKIATPLPNTGQSQLLRMDKFRRSSLHLTSHFSTHPKVCSSKRTYETYMSSASRKSPGSFRYVPMLEKCQFPSLMSRKARSYAI